MINFLYPINILVFSHRALFTRKAYLLVYIMSREEIYQHDLTQLEILVN